MDRCPNFFSTLSKERIKSYYASTIWIYYDDHDDLAMKNEFQYYSFRFCFHNGNFFHEEIEFEFVSYLWYSKAVPKANDFNLFWMYISAFIDPTVLGYMFIIYCLMLFLLKFLHHIHYKYDIHKFEHQVEPKKAEPNEQYNLSPLICPLKWEWKLSRTCIVIIKSICVWIFWIVTGLVCELWKII